MKRTYCMLAALLIVFTLNAQAPDKFNYQAIIRNADGSIRASQNVNIQIGILQGNISGTPIYLETHAVTSSAQGLVNIVIGNGDVVSGSLVGIDWSAGPYYLKLWVDGAVMGTNQLLTVPYAKYAEKAGNGFSGNYNDLADKPTLFDGAYNSLTGKPDLFSGSYNDLTNKPSIPAKTSQLVNDSKFVTSDSLFIYATNGKKYFLIVSELGDIDTKAIHEFGSITDIDGISYLTIKIGTQVWMAENLKTIHYQNGDEIQLITDKPSWDDSGGPAYCFYNNDSSVNYKTFGILYNWFAAINSRNICPTGWHLPSDTDWDKLANYLGGASNAGEKMIDLDSQLWVNGTIGNNKSGFSGIPGGSREGGFYTLGTSGRWWSSTGTAPSSTGRRELDISSKTLNSYYNSSFHGLSIRCVKN